MTINNTALFDSQFNAYDSVKERQELLNAGFSVGELNANEMNERDNLEKAGFNQKEISDHTGYSNDNYLKIIGNSNQRLLQTITPRLDSGYSPIIDVGDKTGSFNFDVAGRLSYRTPGVQYQFEETNGDVSFLQIENDYQGKSWQEADHAESNYNEYLNLDPHVRQEMLSQMWAGNEEVSDYLNEAVENKTPWDIVKTDLGVFNTHRQTSFQSFRVPGQGVTENSYKDIEAFIIENKAQLLSGLKELTIPAYMGQLITSEGEADPEMVKQMERMNFLIKEFKLDRRFMSGDWSIPDTIARAGKGSAVGLMITLEAMLSGDPGAAKDMAEWIVLQQAYGQLGFAKQIVYDVSAVSADLPIMIPAGIAGGAACSALIGTGAATGSLAGPAGALAGTLGGAAITAGCSMGAAFAVPAFIRSLMTDLIEAELVNNEVEFVQLALKALKEGGKEGFIGLITGGVGKYAEFGAKALGLGKFKGAIGTTTLATESIAMTSVGGWMHGYTPGVQDYVKTAAVILTLRGGNKAVAIPLGKVKEWRSKQEWHIKSNLQKLYKEMGVDPREVEMLLKHNPELGPQLYKALSQKEFMAPEIYANAHAAIMKRLSMVTKSEVEVGGAKLELSRYFNVQKGKPTELEVFATEKNNTEANLKITFEMKKGQWVIKDVEGDLNKNHVTAIADYAESKGRKIVLNKDFESISEVIRNREPNKATEELSEIDALVKNTLDEAWLAADTIRQLTPKNDKEAREQAKEIKVEIFKLLSNTVGKEFVTSNKRVIKQYLKGKARVAMKEAENAHFAETGFHFADTVATKQKLKSIVHPIVKLKIPKFDNEVGELIVTHATERSNLTTIYKDGLGTQGGFILFGSDNLARKNGLQMTNPGQVRVHVRYEAPLDLREFSRQESVDVEGALWTANKDFSVLTDNMRSPGGMLDFIQMVLPKNHPAQFTDAQAKTVMGLSTKAEKMAEIIKILEEKGFDSIIYKDSNVSHETFTDTKVGNKVRRSEPGEDGIAIFNAANMKVEAYLKVKREARLESEKNKEKEAEPKVEPTEKSSALETFAKEFKTAEEFIEGLHNRDFKYVKGKDVDKLGLVKTQLARNSIEKQFSLFKLYPKEFDQALSELGVVWSSREKSWIRSPENAKQYFDEHFAKVKDPSKENPKVTKVSEENLRTIFEESTSTAKPKPETKTKTKAETKLDDIIEEGRKEGQEFNKDFFAEAFSGFKASHPRIRIYQADRIIDIDPYVEQSIGFVQVLIQNRGSTKFAKIEMRLHPENGTLIWTTTESQGTRYQPNATVKRIAEKFLREAKEEQTEKSKEEQTEYKFEEADPGAAKPEWTRYPESSDSKSVSDPAPRHNYEHAEGTPEFKAVMNMPALVMLAKELMGGKYPEIKRQLNQADTARGMFSAIKGDPSSATIKLKWDIAKDPLGAARTLAHEIGHLADYLEGTKNATLARGNILGSIGSLNRYLKAYHEGKIGGKKPLTEKEKQKLRREAKKIIENTIETLSKDKKLQEETGMTPQNIKDMHTGVLNKGEVDPRIWTWYQKADRKTKKEVLRAATRGEVWAEIKALEKKYDESPTPDLKGRIKEKYEEILAAEIESRGLLSRDTITDELIKLTQIWRPYDPEANQTYTKYRHNPRELYADFVSVILTAPKLAHEIAPTAYKGFFEFMSRKPDFELAYNRIQKELSSGQVMPKVVKEIHAGYARAKLEKAKLLLERYKDKGKDSMWLDILDKNWMLIKAVSKAGKQDPLKDPVLKAEEYDYRGSMGEGYVGDIGFHILKQFASKKTSSYLNEDFFGEYLQHRRVVQEKGGVERGDIFNPAGLDRVTSAERMKEMEALAPELPGLANEFARIRKEWVIDEIVSSKMFPPELLKKMEQNDAYAKFDVVDHIDHYFGDSQGSKVFGQMGTLKMVDNPFIATMLNDQALLKATVRFKALDSAIDFFGEQAKLMDNIAFEKAEGSYVQGRWEFKKSRNPDMDLVVLYKDGKMRGYYLDKYIVAQYKNNPMDASSVVNVMRLMNTPFRKLFTEMNYGFWAFNAWRDYMRSIRNMPKTTSDVAVPYKMFFKMIPDYAVGLVKGMKRAFGFHDNFISEMLKNKELISVVSSYGDKAGQKYSEAERQMQRHNIIPHEYSSKYTKAVEWLWNHWHNVGQGLETAPKVMVKRYLSRNFPELTSEEVGHILRVQVGSPAFLRQGRFTPFTNNLFMFSNAIKEGWRGDIEVFRERPAEFMWNVFQYNIMPKILMIMAAEGKFGTENEQIMSLIPEYDKTNYIIIPIGLDENEKAVYLRIPQDETAKFFAGAAWKVYSGDGLTDVLSFTSTAQIPSFSPWASVGSNLQQMAAGQIPHDSFRNKPAWSQQIQNAGGEFKRNAFMAHMWDSMGGGIIGKSKDVFGYEFTGDQDKIKGELENYMNMPVVSNLFGRFIKVSDEGLNDQNRKLFAPAIKQKAIDSILSNRFITKTIRAQSEGKTYTATPEEIEAVQRTQKTLKVRFNNINRKMKGTALLGAYINLSSDIEKATMMQDQIDKAAEGNEYAQSFIDMFSK